MKTSAKLATWKGGGVRKGAEWEGGGSDGGVDTTYLKLLLRLEHFGERLAGADAQRVAEEAHLLDVVVVLEPLDVRRDVLGGVELEALALEREDLGVRHGLVRISWIRPTTGFPALAALHEKRVDRKCKDTVACRGAGLYYAGIDVLVGVCLRPGQNGPLHEKVLRAFVGRGEAKTYVRKWIENC